MKNPTFELSEKGGAYTPIRFSAMRFYKTILLVLVYAISFKGNAQSNFGVGVSTAIFPSWNPGLPLTPYIFYRHNNHEFLAGANLYGGQLGFASIIGVEGEYRYHFYHFNNFNLFGDFNCQYVRFANGPARNVPFNYSKEIAPGMNLSMVQMRVFNNTVGMGVQYSFWRKCALHFNMGIGSHYEHNTVSEGISPSQVNPRLLGSRFTVGWMAKFGLSVSLFSVK
jgi:hypothetical protein